MQTLNLNQGHQIMMMKFVEACNAQNLENSEVVLTGAQMLTLMKMANFSEKFRVCFNTLGGREDHTLYVHCNEHNFVYSSYLGAAKSGIECAGSGYAKYKIPAIDWLNQFKKTEFVLLNFAEVVSHSESMFEELEYIVINRPDLVLAVGHLILYCDSRYLPEGHVMESHTLIEWLELLQVNEYVLLDAVSSDGATTEHGVLQWDPSRPFYVSYLNVDELDQYGNEVLDLMEQKKMFSLTWRAMYSGVSWSVNNLYDLLWGAQMIEKV